MSNTLHRNKYALDYTIAWLTLFSGLSISAVAVYYSVAGLMSIFAAAAIPIMIMGVFLEASKLVASLWLKKYWHEAPTAIKVYLCAAVVILMIITSMGIYGYLSRAHLEQATPATNAQAQVEVIDDKIRMHQENIIAARKTLAQLDSAVDQTMSRSDSAQGASNAIYIRRMQTKERSYLTTEINNSQAEISKLTEEREPFAKELRAVEAEVGPLKYIAALIYGDAVDTNTLEKAVRGVIIMIVLVFDPLAIVLLLTSQYSFQYIQEKKSKEPVYDPTHHLHIPVATTTPEPIVEPETTPEPSQRERLFERVTYAYELPKQVVTTPAPVVETTPEPVVTTTTEPTIEEVLDVIALTPHAPIPTSQLEEVVEEQTQEEPIVPVQDFAPLQPKKMPRRWSRV